jgi:hypothetical protein
MGPGCRTPAPADATDPSGGVDPTANMANEVNDVVAVAVGAGDRVLVVDQSSGVVELEAVLASRSGSGVWSSTSRLSLSPVVWEERHSFVRRQP